MATQSSTSSLYLTSCVILFRNENDRDDSNNYIDVLKHDNHILIECVPVLEHEFLLTPTIIDELLGSSDKIAAIIFTSKNAVKALQQAACQWLLMSDSDDEKLTRNSTWSDFLAKPVFVVGRATGAACNSLLYPGNAPGDIRGQESGKASSMLPEIEVFCQTYQKQNGFKPRLLFFCGDKRRDTLPNGIRQSQVADELVEVVSYTTVGRSADQVRTDLSAVLDKIRDLAIPRSGEHVCVWMVCFSPSGVRVVAPLLAEIAEQRGDASILRLKAPWSTACANEKMAAFLICHYKMVAIGETTLSEMMTMMMHGEQRQQRPWSKETLVLANEPSVQGIRNAISRFEQKMRQQVEMM